MYHISKISEQFSHWIDRSIEKGRMIADYMSESTFWMTLAIILSLLMILSIILLIGI